MMKKESLLSFLKRNREFRFLLAGQTVSQLGDALNWMANLGLVAIIAPGIGTSFLMIWLMIPIVTLGPFAGVVVDRFSRKKIMIISDILRASTVFLFILALINYIGVKNEEFIFEYNKKGIISTENKSSEIISKKEKSIKERYISARINKFNSSIIEISVKGDFGNSKIINGTISSNSEDYENIKLEKKGECYIGIINKKYSDNSKKKNKNLEMKDNGKFSVNITEKLGPTFLVYLITFFVSLVTQFFIPAKSSIIPELVEKDELVYANSISATIARIVMIAGGAIGGFIIGRYGIVTALWADFISSTLSVVTICFIKEKKQLSIHQNKIEESKGFIKEFKEGIIYLTRKPSVRFSVFSYIAVMAVGGIGYIFLIKYSNETLRMGVEGLGYLQTALGVGLISGAFLVGLIGNKIEKTDMIKIGIVVVSVSSFIFAFAEKIYFALAAGILAGAGGAFIIVMSETVLQTVVKTEFRGRIFGILQTMTNAAFAIFAIATGFIFSGFEERTIFISIAVFMVIFLIINQFINSLKGKIIKNG